MTITTSWPIFGHEWAINQLHQAILNRRSRHAYLFTGPASIGKTTLALALATTLNCQNPNPPCGHCRSCKLIIRNAHPDVTITEADRVGGVLKIDQVRELQHTLALRPYEAPYKVAILRRFHEANAATQNALLKTLEEPAQNVVLILTSEQTDRLLPTILSRCQVLNLRPLSLEQTYHVLQTQRSDVDPQQLNLIARLSGGRLGWAFRTLEDLTELELRTGAIDALEEILSTANRVVRFQKAEELTKDKTLLLTILQYWLTYWRDLLHISSGSQTALVNIDREKQLFQLAEKLASPQIYAAIEATRRTMKYLNQNVNTRLSMEVLLVDYPLGKLI